MNRTQRDRYLDKMNRYHEAVAEALERAKRNNINKPYDIATLILTSMGNYRLDIRDTIKPDKRAEYRFGTCGDED